MRRILAQAGKEFRQFSRDRLTRTLAAGLPLLMVSLYGTALTSNVQNLTLAIDDLDRTALSRRYTAAFVATNKFRVVPRTATPERMIGRGQARAVLTIPPGFARDFEAGRAAAVELVIDGTESNTALVLRTINAAVAATFDPSPSPRGPATPPVQLKTRHWFNPGREDRLFFGSGALGLVLILFPALLGAVAAARERELGTVVQAYASTLTAPEWVVGKALPYIAVGFVQFLLCYSFGVLLFGYPFPQRPEVLAAGTLVYLTSGVFYGMLAGAATGTQSAAIQAVQFGAFLLSMMLSGFLVPVTNFPPAMQVVSNLVAARHYVEMSRDVMLRGGDWSTSARPLIALCALTLLFLAANVAKMRRMQSAS